MAGSFQSTCPNNYQIYRLPEGLIVKKPNFFIIGAPKCGTTALSEYLKTHPNIYLAEPKEPHYFNTDFDNRTTTDLQQYLRYFKDVEDSRWAIGEASVFYLYSQVAVSQVLDFNPDARFIVMLRNPVEMVQSWHDQLVYVSGHNIDFENAWRLQKFWRSPQLIPKNCREQKLFEYGKLCLLGSQVARLYDQVDRSRVKVILFDDFKSNTLGVYKDTLAFLSVPFDGRIDFPEVNIRKVSRFPFLHQAYLVLFDWMMVTKQRLGLLHKNYGLVSKLMALNTQSGSRPQLSPALIAELEDYFAEDIQKLSALIDRDLSHWLTTQRAVPQALEPASLNVAKLEHVI